MKIISFVSNLAMPMIILLIVICGLREKNNVFDNFIDGAKEGIQTTITILPTLVGLFVAIGALRSSRNIRINCKCCCTNAKYNTFSWGITSTCIIKTDFRK